MNRKRTKTINYQMRTKDGRPWGGTFKQKRQAIRQKNRTWPQINVVRITTIIEVVA